VHKDAFKDGAILKSEGAFPMLLVRLHKHVAEWSILVPIGMWTVVLEACARGMRGPVGEKRSEAGMRVFNRRTCHMPMYDEPFA